MREVHRREAREASQRRGRGALVCEGERERRAVSEESHSPSAGEGKKRSESVVGGYRESEVRPASWERMEAPGGIVWKESEERRCRRGSASNWAA